MVFWQSVVVCLAVIMSGLVSAQYEPMPEIIYVEQEDSVSVSTDMVTSLPSPGMYITTPEAEDDGEEVEEGDDVNDDEEEISPLTPKEISIVVEEPSPSPSRSPGPSPVNLEIIVEENEDGQVQAASTIEDASEEPSPSPSPSPSPGPSPINMEVIVEENEDGQVQAVSTIDDTSGWPAWPEWPGSDWPAWPEWPPYKSSASPSPSPSPNQDPDFFN